MSDSALFPPNARNLSDAVIFQALQRVKPSDKSPAPASRAPNSLLTMRSSAFNGANVLSDAADHAAPIASLHRIESLPPAPSSITGHKLLPSLSSYTDSIPSTAEFQAKPTTSRPTKKIVQPTASDDTELRRQRNREHQARYKMKQNNKVTDLEHCIGALKDEIQDLKLQRQIVTFGEPGTHTRWSVIAEYFRLFRNGIKPPQSMGEYGSAETLVPVESHAQRRFLQTTMASDVVGTIGFGVDALLQNWKLISLCHPDIDIQLVRLECGPGDSLIAITRGSHTITEDTIRYAFPHLAEGCEDDRWLASRLLGQKFVMNGCTRVIWDNEAGCVVRIQYTANLLSPMLQLLGNLDDVSRVFTNSRLNPESRFAVS